MIEPPPHIDAHFPSTNGNDGNFVITKGIKMGGIFADQHPDNRPDKSDIKARPENGRGAHLNTALKPIDRHAGIDAYDGQRSPRHHGRSPNASGLASEAADGLSVQSRSDQRFFVHNGIIHDVRNVLQVLLSGLWVAQDRIREGRAGEVPAIFGEIGEAVDRANALLRRLQRTPSSPEKRTSAVDIGKVLARLDTSLRWALGTSNALAITVGSDLPKICCVEAELENAVLNLVINARDAMPARGRVTIEAIRDERSGVILRIHDTGVGMDIDVAAKAFAPYFTTKGATTGKGLGLATVAAFARSIGGSARIEHTSANGTTMALYLPHASRT
jgi:signal transduction histidine kinase